MLLGRFKYRMVARPSVVSRHDTKLLRRRESCHTPILTRSIIHDQNDPVPRKMQVAVLAAVLQVGV